MKKPPQIEPTTFRKAVIVTRFVPWPSDNGGFLYTALLCDLAAEFAEETVVVAAEHPRGMTPHPQSVRTAVGPARRVSPLRYLASGLPFAAHRFNTPALRNHAREAMVGADLILIDHIGASWALDLALAAREEGARLIYVAHNVESDTRRTAFGAGALPAAFAKFDHRRVAVVERRLLQETDAVICISSADRDDFYEMGAAADLIVINPVHSAPPNFVRLDGDTPHRVILIGSFHWRAKQRNLLRFLAARKVVPSAAEINLRVVGSMPPSFQRMLDKQFPDVEVIGSVEKIEEHVDGCRIGVIPEEEGGGFKLKALDYAYAGLPIFGLSSGVRGLPLREGVSMRSFTTMEKLWIGIIDSIEELSELNYLRSKALAAFESGANAVHLRAAFERSLNGETEGSYRCD